MEVAYWELAPFFPDMHAVSCEDFIRNNAGRPFEVMVEECDAARQAAGLPPLEEVRCGRVSSAVHCSWESESHA